MNNKILVSATELNDLIEAGDCTVVDCRFDLANPDKGRADWLSGHIPGAAYAHLDDDLAAPIEAHTGRHPLPTAADFARYLASTGWRPGKLLVAYDDGSNAISARLWWMMRYFGQPSALLDGGLAAWRKAGFALEKGDTTAQAATLAQLLPARQMTVTSEDIQDSIESTQLLVLDARAPERYSGKVEFLDTKAGHIPNALNWPFTRNLGRDGRFLDAETLRAQFETLLSESDPAEIVHSCGSGVTACHNLFAMELAGLGFTRLYPGSWSEWIRDPGRPVKTGEAP